MSKFKTLIRLNTPVNIISSSSVVGNREVEGPLGKFFDITLSDDRFGMKTYEQAESQMVKMSCESTLNKCKYTYGDIDLIIGGDLQNQCVGHSFAVADSNSQYMGIYGACSSMAQGLVLSSLLIDSGHFSNILTSASSHFSTSERQFRFPLEYGLQRTPTSQTTVTGAGSFILSSNIPSDIKVTSALIGIITDRGIKDANNMGAAMACAALDTLQRYFAQSDNKESDFDLILTGDLGIEGASIVRETCHTYSLSLGDNYKDCGELIFDSEKQCVFSGGSGCGCSAVVLASYVMELLKKREIKRVLFVGTGALLSSGSVLQKMSIPGIAHLVEIVRS
ncbi:MAG: stage V sporulation protein AD [Ruminococcaceae bacterium]|nr:stage V sporulation protein AD [Oscillospiraceae bacterium]